MITQKNYLVALALISATAQAAPHETVCGGKAVEAAEALLKLNRNDIVAFSQDSSSMKLVNYKHQAEGSFELWDTALNVQTKSGTSYRATPVRALINIDFGSDGSVVCTVREISTPSAD
jgi:hypothetical protein